MRGDNDNPAIAGQTFRPSVKALLMPSLVIAAGYVALFAWLYFSDRSAGAIGRLCLVVLSLGVPFLAAHAVLRAVTIRLQALPHAAIVHRGFPGRGIVEIPYRMIRSTEIRRGLANRLVGGGTLAIVLEDGVTVAVAELADPETAKEVIELRAWADTLPLPERDTPALSSAHF